MADLATLKLVVDSSGAIRAVDQFGNATEVAGKKVKGLESSLGSMVAKFATFAVAAKTIQTIIRQTSEFQRTTAALENVVRTTGEAAGRSVQQLNAHADALRRITAAGGNEIRETQARLLSYTGVVGKEFDRATVAALNWSQAYGVRGVEAAEALGKALNFPTRGLAALTKQGFIFSAAQMEQIKHFEETNQLAKAQAIILAEVESVTNGAAAAYRNTLGGALKAVKESFLDLFEAEGPGMKKLIENINTLADTLAIIPVQLDIIAEKFKNVALQYETFFEPILFKRGGRKVREAQARLEGRPFTPEAPAAQRLAESNATLDALTLLLEELKQRNIAGAAARANAGTPGGAPGVPGVPEAARAFRDLSLATTTVVMDLRELGRVARLERIEREERVRREQLGRLMDPRGGGVALVLPKHGPLFDNSRLTQEQIKAKEAAERALAAWEAAEAAAEEAGRVFKEQTQIALGNFFSDFFKSGTSSFKAFWEQFQSIGFQAIGNLMAKIVMEKIDTFLDSRAGKNVGAGLFGIAAGQASGSGLGGALGGAVGGYAQGGFVGAAIGAVTGLISGLFEQGKRAREAAEAQRLATEQQSQAMREMLGQLKRSTDAWVNDFLNFSATESDTERELRQIANARNELARRAFDIARGTPGSLMTNQMMNFGTQGDYASLLIALRGSAASLSPPLRALLDQLELLDEAFQRNSASVAEATRMQQLAERARQAQSLTAFRESLLLSGQSTLSPMEQLAEARRQYDVITALAEIGDASAIASLPGTARALLDASRAVNASGVRYAEDFQRVTEDTARLIAALQADDPGDAIPTPWENDLMDVQLASLTVQQDGFGAVVDAVEEGTATLDARLTRLELVMQEMADA